MFEPVFVWDSQSKVTGKFKKVAEQRGCRLVDIRDPKARDVSETFPVAIIWDRGINRVYNNVPARERFSQRKRISFLRFHHGGTRGIISWSPDPIGFIVWFFGVKPEEVRYKRFKDGTCRFQIFKEEADRDDENDESNLP